MISIKVFVIVAVAIVAVSSDDYLGWKCHPKEDAKDAMTVVVQNCCEDLLSDDECETLTGGDTEQAKKIYESLSNDEQNSMRMCISEAQSIFNDDKTLDVEKVKAGLAYMDFSDPAIPDAIKKGLDSCEGTQDQKALECMNIVFYSNCKPDESDESDDE